MELSPLCQDSRALCSLINFHLSHILAEALIHNPILPLVLQLLKPAFSIISISQEHFNLLTSRPDCLMQPLKPLESPWQLQTCIKQKKEASVHYFYDKWGKKRPEKMQWQVVYHLSAYESGVFAMISPWASFTCKWDWASTDSLSYITASVFWLGRAGILFSVLGENCLVIRP